MRAWQAYHLLQVVPKYSQNLFWYAIRIALAAMYHQRFQDNSLGRGYTCGLLLYQLGALSGFVQAGALDLSQNGIGHFGIPSQRFRLNHVSTRLVGRHGGCGSGHS